jgi:hypothetical protein
MSWFRNLAALAAAAALMLTPHLLPATAATSHGVSAPVAASKAAARPLVQGVVTDQFGRYVDGVQVRATRADGTAAASAESYASAWADGPQHGYFFLEVGKVGTYTVTLSKKGYKTVEYAKVVVTRKRKVVSLGEIEIAKVLASTTTSALLTKAAISTKDRGSVVVTVATKATKKPVGGVEIREGNKVVGSGVLKSSHHGKLTVILEKLSKGSHTLRAYFLGSESLAASTSKRPVTLVVSKPRR